MPKFKFKFSNNRVINIDRYDIFAALYNRKVISTMPLVILALAVAPRIVHIVGKLWPKYTRSIASRLIKWLNMNISQNSIIKSTRRPDSPYVYRKSQKFYGFSLIYSSFGPNFLKKYKQNRYCKN